MAFPGWTRQEFPRLWPEVIHRRSQGIIPIHNHFYIQTMYMLTGELMVYSHDPETDEKVKEKRIGPDDFVFVPSMEPHSMTNPSDSQEATFLCCIANVYEE